MSKFQDSRNPSDCSVLSSDAQYRKSCSSLLSRAITKQEMSEKILKLPLLIRGLRLDQKAGFH